MITGTCQLNNIMMEYFESYGSDIIKALNSNLRVLYRVTPFYYSGLDNWGIWVSDNVPRGVEIEAFSIEDEGKSVCLHVFIFNKQDGVEINYSDGSSHLCKK